MRRASTLACLLLCLLVRLPAAAVDEAVVASWDGKLRARLSARLAAGERPRLSLASLGMDMRVTALGDDGTMQIEGDGAVIPLPWKRLAAEDKSALAAALARERNPDDAALVAFYHLLAGRRRQAGAWLRRAGDAGSAVAALFPGPAAADGDVGEDGGDGGDGGETDASQAPPLAYTGPYGFRRDGTARFPECDPPLSWSPGGANVMTCALPGTGNSSPVLTADKVFLTCEPNLLVCIDRRSMEILWQAGNSNAEALGDPARDEDLPSPDWLKTYGYTTPTPVVHQGHVWAVFGHGVVTCFTVDGQRVWAKPFEAKNRVAGIATSPCLVGDILIFTGKGRPRTVGLDAATGDRRWGVGGSGEGSFATVEIAGATHVVTSFGKLIRAADGREVQTGMLGGGFKDTEGDRASNWGPTPCVADGVAFFHVHFKKSSLCNTAIRAVRLSTPEQPGAQLWEYYTNADGNIRGRMGRSHLYYDGLVYAIKNNGLLQVLDAATGDLVYEREKLGGGYVSLTSAGGKIFHFNKKQVVILAPGREYRELARFTHGFQAKIASPVFDKDLLYFRDHANLYVVKKQ